MKIFDRFKHDVVITNHLVSHRGTENVLCGQSSAIENGLRTLPVALMIKVNFDSVRERRWLWANEQVRKERRPMEWNGVLRERAKA